MTTPQNTNLYDPLPTELGGHNVRPVSAALNALVPIPRGGRRPREEAFNSSIRNRVLLLEGEPKKVENKHKFKSLFRPYQKKGKPHTQKLKLVEQEKKYDLYQPLARLWTDYAENLLRDEQVSDYGDRILRMDLHGAYIEVIRSRDPGLIGQKGILVAEMANTIIIITEKNAAITIPKRICVIQLAIANAIVEISLPALLFRSSERSARKFKKRHLQYL